MKGHQGVDDFTEEYVNEVALSRHFDEPLHDIRGREYTGGVVWPGLWKGLKVLLFGGEFGIRLSGSGWRLTDVLAASSILEREEEEREKNEKEMRRLKRQSSGGR